MTEEDRATVSVLKSHDKWYGITYKEDKPVVVEAMQKMKDNGYIRSICEVRYEIKPMSIIITGGAGYIAIQLWSC